MKALLTGGGGFLGRAILQQLMARGDRVRIIVRGSYPELDHSGVEALSGDVADLAAVRAAVDGMDVVFHVAAKTGYWGPPAEFLTTNVLGTRNVIRACREKGAPRLVFTSTPTVIAQDRDLEGVDESEPYPELSLCDYQRSKTIAEKEVIAANGQDGVSTIVLRPHNIWGPGDPHFIPRLASRARAGVLRQIGDGTNRVDITYIDDAAAAHLLAADKLGTDSAVGGRVYFISQGEPVLLWPFFNCILEALDLPAVGKRLAYSRAWTLGHALELAYRMLRLRGEPRLTRFLVVQLGRSHYFSIRRAQTDLNFSPRIGVEEGLARMLAYYRAHPLK